MTPEITLVEADSPGAVTAAIADAADGFPTFDLILVYDDQDQPIASLAPHHGGRLVH